MNSCKRCTSTTWTMPERAMTSPRSLLNSKECLSCKADFINFTIWGKSPSLTCLRTNVLSARWTAVCYRLYFVYKLKIYYKWNNTQFISSRVTKMIKCSCSLFIKGGSCWPHWNYNLVINCLLWVEQFWQFYLLCDWNSKFKIYAT